MTRAAWTVAPSGRVRMESGPVLKGPLQVDLQAPQGWPLAVHTDPQSGTSSEVEGAATSGRAALASPRTPPARAP